MLNYLYYFIKGLFFNAMKVFGLNTAFVVFSAANVASSLFGGDANG